MTDEKRSSSRSLLCLLMVLPVVMITARGALADPTAAGKTHAGNSKAAEGKSAAGTCSLSHNVNAWGRDGNAGWAREWLLGQCDLANSAVR